AHNSPLLRRVSDPFSNRPVVGNFQELRADLKRSEASFNPQILRKRLNFVQQAKKAINEGDKSGGVQSGDESTNTSLIDGVRKFALDMRELDIDLIDRINPFGEAYAILSKAMTADRLEQLKAIIAAKRATLSLDEARDLAKRALIFKKEKNRLPSITAMDPWEKRMAEGIAFLQRKAKEEANG
ncbi:MAG: hypothetical protein ACK6AY_10070, partial [Akkermansiaceae bacterium]